VSINPYDHPERYWRWTPLEVKWIEAAIAQAVAAERERMNQHAVVLAETARLVEKERCALICDGIAEDDMTGYGIASDCAAAIRALDTPEAK
jgi:hypothetical protein